VRTEPVPVVDRGSTDPAVSVVLIFKDEERFIAEAIESVAAQTFTDWELVLVDDGSTDASTDIAKRWAAAAPERIRYVDHDAHRNLGMSASRNLGIVEARGRYIASLDADDAFLPDKLADQVFQLESHPDAAMVFGPLLRWRRWTGDPEAVDHEDLMGVGRRKYGTHPLAGKVVPPPALASLMLGDDYFIPGGALFRTGVLQSVGCYDPSFRGMYEDAVLMMKICARYPVLVTDQIGYLYRMHPESNTHLTSGDAEIDRSRNAYLDRVGELFDELEAEGRPVPRSLWRAWRRAYRSSRRRRRLRHELLAAGRAVGRVVLPAASRDWLRHRWRDRTRPDVL